MRDMGSATEICSVCRNRSFLAGQWIPEETLEGRSNTRFAYVCNVCLARWNATAAMVHAAQAQKAAKDARKLKAQSRSKPKSKPNAKAKANIRRTPRWMNVFSNQS